MTIMSNVFTRNKKDGGKHMILNLKQFNTHITYCHCKMESINQVIDIVISIVYMASIELKDAFYSIPIHPELQKYLKLVVLSKIYQYPCMPNGYGPAIRIFTKVSKVPFHTYEVDDSYLQGNTYKACLHNIENNWIIAEFRIHYTFYKIYFYSNTKNNLSWFVIDSVQMTIEIIGEKKNQIHMFRSFSKRKNYFTDSS